MTDNFTEISNYLEEWRSFGLFFNVSYKNKIQKVVVDK